MLFDKPLLPVDSLRAAVQAAYLLDESTCIKARLHAAALPVQMRQRIQEIGTSLSEGIRERYPHAGSLDAFMHEYDLASHEGVMLMCLAEALLRIPDAKTADLLIEDKLLQANWAEHMGASDSLLVNASTWALMLTGRIAKPHDCDQQPGFEATLQSLVTRSGEVVVRQALVQAMKIVAREFVMGRTIEEALARAEESEQRGYRYSYDMLGESAHTQAEAEDYFESYMYAIEAIGKYSDGRGPVEGPGISVKLSALHPRYEFSQRERVMVELVPRLKTLLFRARDYDIGLTIDAEETERLDLSLTLVEAVFSDSRLAGWAGFGLAVQAYQKRALPVIDWLEGLARRYERRLAVRLVKGAYWDREIKQAQALGLPGYPVFTRKAATDVSFVACMKRLFSASHYLYPQFATHNAHTVASVLAVAGDGHTDFEFQRLHGMGEMLYDQIVGESDNKQACRVYAPVGSHEHLLPYLVRRLLENGANTSFVNHVLDKQRSIAEIIADPIAKMMELEEKPHPHIPLPQDLYMPDRENSKGIDLTDPMMLQNLMQELQSFTSLAPWTANPLINGIVEADGEERPIYNPAEHHDTVGLVVEASVEHVKKAIGIAQEAQHKWDATPVDKRAAYLRRAADLFDSNRAELMALCMREGGKTVDDAVAEVREASDFLRYYAMMARQGFAQPSIFHGTTGEHNAMTLHGRGVFVCISPWNFPLAIFTGQIGAALASGNAVIAKPAEQTPLIAMRAIQLLHAGGIPFEVLHFLPGSGKRVGTALVSDARIAGVVFTGSTETARTINGVLANKPGPIIPLIAETGGQNAMIVDSSALTEQVVRDVISSAFHSAGQRCSALRVLYLQEEVADRIIEMLTGAMAELNIGNPCLLSTDIGPVIDSVALEKLKCHYEMMCHNAQLLYQCSLPEGTEEGTFFAPCAFEIKDMSLLTHEVFGPVLHIIRYASQELDNVIEAINNTGYGLTLGIHSRIDSRVDYIQKRVKVGNIYVNRNQIGAIVGVQPFGGEGLSGTGPKAGGPHYLYRFVTERMVTIDTTAAGGNTTLATLSD